MNPFPLQTRFLGTTYGNGRGSSGAEFEFVLGILGIVFAAFVCYLVWRYLKGRLDVEGKRYDALQALAKHDRIESGELRALMPKPRRSLGQLFWTVALAFAWFALLFGIGFLIAASIVDSSWEMEQYLTMGGVALGLGIGITSLPIFMREVAKVHASTRA